MLGFQVSQDRRFRNLRKSDLNPDLEISSFEK
jgi:hypothetical protein